MIKRIFIFVIFIVINVYTVLGFSFTVTADMRSSTGPGQFPAVLDAITATGGPGAFMLIPGDLDPPWNVEASLNSEFGSDFIWYPVIGNHEAETSSDMDWLRNYNDNGDTLPGIVNIGPPGSVETTYSFDYEGAHFVALNEYYDGSSDVGTDGDIVPALYDWLADDLAATDKKWIFVMGHEPAYPQPDADWGDSRHVGDSLDQYPVNRDNFWQLLAHYNVTAYFCGHTHRYSRYLKDEVWQVDSAQARGTDQYDTFLRVTVEDSRVTFDTYRSLYGTFALTDSFLRIEVPLSMGWNLISVPIDTNRSLPTFLKSIEGKYARVLTYNSNDYGNEWKLYSNVSAHSNLNHVDEKTGILIKMLEEAVLVIDGSEFEEVNISLQQGYNLIGYPSLEEKNITSVFNGLNVTNIFTYENNTCKHYNPLRPDHVNTLKTMKPGYGYWVYANDNVDIKIS